MSRIGSISLNIPWKQQGEGKTDSLRVVGLFLYLFFVVSASTVGRTAADTLFLSRFDASQLSLMYLPQAISLILIGFLFQRYGSRMRLDRLILLLIPLVCLLVAASRVGVGMDLVWVYPVIYVGYDVINFLMIVCFWQFASSVLDQRRVKKTIPLVGSGGIVGGIISGFGLKLIAPLVGTVNLIYFYAGLQLLALLAVVWVIRMCTNPAETFGNPHSAKTKQGNAGARSSETNTGLFRNVPHLKYVAIMSAALVISLTFIDYQFKVILRGSLQNEELAGFMGSFYGFSGLIGLLVQLFVAGKLVSRFGVMISILVFPLALLAGSIGVIFMPILAMAILVKGSDKVLGDTIYSSVNQLIMFPISPQWRNRAKSFLDGIVRNGAKGLAAVSLIVLSPILSAREFSFVIVVLLGVGIFAAIKVKGAYLKMLLSTLETRGTDLNEGELDLMDPASRKLLIMALQSSNHQQVLYALRILTSLNDFDLSPYIPSLLRHPVAEVGVEVLLYIEQVKPVGMDGNLSRLLAENTDPRVKSQALIALSSYAKDQYLELISAQLEAVEVEIRAGAIAGLIKYYGIEGMFRAVGILKDLIESSSEEERTAMAALFGRIGIQEFYKPLIPLLQDTSAAVQKNALQSAEKLVVPELIPFLVPLLQNSHTRREAIEALAAYDAKELLPLLEPYLGGQHSASLHVPKVFERVGTQAAYAMLLRIYAKTQFDMRDKLLEALTGMRGAEIQADSNEVTRLALLELESYGKFAEHNSWPANHTAEEEVQAATEQLRSSMIGRVFQLLSLIHHAQTIDAVYIGWSEGDVRRQANATEVMDQLLHGELRTELTRWMLAPKTTTNAAGKKEHISWLYKHGDEGLREVIRYAIMESKETRLNEKLGTPAQLTEIADNEATIRERMWRMRALRNSSLFEGFTSKDLLPLIRYLQLIDVPAGQIVFQEGDPGDSLYIVREGRAGVYRNGVRIDTREPADSFGQTAVLTRRLRTASIHAETNLSLLRLDFSDFYEVMFDRTELALVMMKVLSRKLRSAMNTPVNPSAILDKNAPALTEVSLKEVAAALETSDNHNHNQAIIRRMLVLQKIDLFAHLSQADFIRLAHLVEEIAFKPGEVICRMDDHGDTMYGIIEGNIRVHRGAENLAQLGVGQCFGEMAIIDSGPRSADCTAVEHTLLLRLDRHQVFSFCFQQMDVLKSMMKVLADRLRDTA